MTKDWDRLKEVILDLYKQQGKTLDETRRFMEENHGFKASTRAYRSRLKRWDVTKYSKSPRRGSAPVGSAAATYTMPGSAAMTPSRTYPGAAAPARTRPTASSSHALSPYSADANSPQFRDDTYESSNDHYSSAVSPQIQAVESLPYAYSPSLLQQQPQQYRYIPQRGYHVGIQPEQHQMNSFCVPGQNQTHQAALRPRLAMTSPHRQQQIHSRLEPKADTCFARLQTLLSTQLSTTQADADQRIDLVSRSAQQLAMLGGLDDRVFRVDGGPEILLTALELCVFTYMTHHPWAPRFFCQLCSTLVRHGASTERLVPQGLGATVRAMVRGQGTGPMNQLLASHQQQYGAMLCEFPVTPIWLSACELHLRGDGVAVGEHLSVLEWQHQLQPLQPLQQLLPELSYNPISPVSLQHAHDAWSP